MKKYKILKSKDDQWYFVMIASNGQILATSETYTTKQSCKIGIASSRKFLFASVIDTTNTSEI